MKNNKKGFTLVELVIVVAVMAILVAVAIPTIGSITAKADAAVLKSNMQTCESILKLEEAEAKTDGGSLDYIQALNDAKLGISDTVTFYYLANGDVTDTAPAANETTATLTFYFDADGVAQSGTKPAG